MSSGKKVSEFLKYIEQRRGSKESDHLLKVEDGENQSSIERMVLDTKNCKLDQTLKDKLSGLTV